jgi:protein-tyrosine phosphatase
MTDPGIFLVSAPGPGRLAVLSRPRRSSDFAALKAAGIDMLVSMLEPAEADSVGLGEAALSCERAGIDYLSVPITDHGIPASFQLIEQAVDIVARQLLAGRGVGAHCYAGLGRSPLFVASVLILHGQSAPQAIASVSAARGVDVPEMDQQHDWLMQLAARRNS